MPQQGARQRNQLRTQTLCIFYVVEFQGRISNTGPGGDYAFIEADSIRRIDGGKGLGFDLPGDLRLHVRKNQKLGNPLPKDAWVRFFIGPDDHSLHGMEVVNARLLRPRT